MLDNLVSDLLQWVPLGIGPLIKQDAIETGPSSFLVWLEAASDLCPLTLSCIISRPTVQTLSHPPQN